MKRKVTKKYFWVTIEIFELTKDEFETSNRLEIVRCLSVKKLLNEDILTEFSKENNNTNNYYCSLVFQPKPNNFVNVRECDKNLRNINYSFLFLLYFQIIYIWVMNICLKKGHRRREIQRFAERLEEGNPYRFNRLQGLISLNRMLNLLWELININIIENMSQSQMSTEKVKKIMKLTIILKQKKQKILLLIIMKIMK